MSVFLALRKYLSIWHSDSSFSQNLTVLSPVRSKWNGRIMRYMRKGMRAGSHWSRQPKMAMNIDWFTSTYLAQWRLVFENQYPVGISLIRGTKSLQAFPIGCHELHLGSKYIDTGIQTSRVGIFLGPPINISIFIASSQIDVNLYTEHI